jgi:hypothetical protein
VNQDLEPVPDRLLAFDYGILDDRVPQIDEKLHKMDIEGDDATDLPTLSAKAESRLVASIQGSIFLSSLALVCLSLRDPHCLKFLKYSREIDCFIHTRAKQKSLAIIQALS